MPAKLSRVCQLSLALVCTASVVQVGAAQTPAAHPGERQESAAPGSSAGNAKKAESKRRWRVSPSFQVDAEYDNNVFLLSSGRKNNVSDPSSDDLISGRYTNMKAPSDVLTTLSAGLSVKGPGVLGKSSLIVPEVTYELYAQNTRRSNLSLGLALLQQAGATGRLRLEGKLTPSYFARNYLADAVDLDSDGSISDAERLYARGEYREGEVGADYRLPLSRSRKSRPFGAALQLGGGYYGRSYDAPLQGRNLRGPTAAARLLFDLGRRMELDLGYDFSSLAADVTSQVLLLDESQFGQDLNGNGSSSDIAARVLTPVDRSRREHSLGATLHFEPSRPLDVTLGYEHRWREYTSEQSLDVANRGRTDRRHQLSADLRFRLQRDLRLRIGGIYSTQNLNRTGDPGSTGEIDDYTRSQARLGLSYQL